MSRTNLARRAALLVAVGAIATATTSSTAEAQRTTVRPGRAGQAPPAPPPAVPYPGASVIVDPRGYGSQPVHTRYPNPYPQRHDRRRGGEVVYVPVPAAYGYPSGGYGGGGGVYDTNGRPLYSGFEEPAAASPESYPTHGTPDLSGSPYVVIDGGMMVVDFGHGDRRAVPACAALAAEATPDGKARTVFYRPPVDGLVLRAGQRGRVLGQPAPRARVCYTADVNGRMVLDY